MNQEEKLSKLFGSRSRVSLLRFLFQNHNKKYRVNQLVRKTKVNSRLVSSELKKLSEIGILTSSKAGNALFYQVNKAEYFFEPLKRIFVKTEWTEWERPSRIHHLVLTLEAGLKPMKEYYGHCLPYAHLVFNYDNVSWLFRWEEFVDLGKRLIPIYKKSKKEIWRDFENFASKLWEMGDYASFYKQYLNFWKVAYITEPISFYIDGLLKPGEHISIQDQSFTDVYEDRLWELAKEAKKVGIEKIDVKPVLEDFHWIRNSYYGIHRLTEDEVRTEVRKKIGKRKPQSKRVKDPTSLPKDLLEIGKDMVLMQDIRKKYMMEAAYQIHELLKAVGAPHKIGSTLMAQSLPWEVVKIKEPDQLKKKLEMRLQACTITGSLTDGIKVFDGKIFFPEGLHRSSKFEIRGKVACGGKALGRARVVMKDEDIYQVNHGDVIVAPMTSPNFMPAIRRSVAIVTDFGGITCHAAIISREFSLPCVVSTNNATELIENGDLIEVDADKGIVKVLQKAF